MRLVALALVASLSAALPAAEAGGGGGGGGGAGLDQAVAAIFERHCVECHGSQRRRPKGGFGFVDDLARVAAEPKLIVAGAPDESPLFQLLVHDDPNERMPSAKATNGPLDPEQIETVRRWIEGLPAAAP